MIQLSLKVRKTSRCKNRQNSVTERKRKAQKREWICFKKSF